MPLLLPLAPDRRRSPRRARAAAAAGSCAGRDGRQLDQRVPSDESPIFIVRLVEESGCIMNGGAAQVGSVGATVASRSCTSWRAFSRSVPRSKMSVIEESCSTDFERITSSPGRREVLLERDGDELLDLGGGEAERRRLDLDPRRRELREDVDRRRPQLRDAEDHQRDRGQDDERSGTSGSTATIQRIMRGRGRLSGRPRTRCRSSSAAPTLTTAVPAVGPAERTRASPSIRRRRPARGRRPAAPGSCTPRSSRAVVQDGRVGNDRLRLAAVGRGAVRTAVVSRPIRSAARSVRRTRSGSFPSMGSTRPARLRRGRVLARLPRSHQSARAPTRTSATATRDRERAATSEPHLDVSSLLHLTPPI